MEHVPITPLDPFRFSPVIGEDRTDLFAVKAAEEALERLHGRSVINVNSTAAGGGVAEMLHVLLGLIRGVGIDALWLVIDGNPEFFEVTKRLHNHLYGTAGDGGELGPAEHRIYDDTLQPEKDCLLYTSDAADDYLTV